MLKEVMARCGLTFKQVSITFISTMLTDDTLMRMDGFPLSAADLLNIYTIVWPKQETDMNLFMINHYLRLRNKQQR